MIHIVPYMAFFFSTGGGPPPKLDDDPLTDAIGKIIGEDNWNISGMVCDWPADAALIQLDDSERYVRGFLSL